jgi:hypothetical protein
MLGESDWPNPAAEDEKLKDFISYSRKDVLFAQRIIAASDIRWRRTGAQTGPIRRGVKGAQRALAKIAKQDNCKRNNYAGDPKEENESHIVSGHALSFRNIRYDRRWLIRPPFQMIARARIA